MARKTEPRQVPIDPDAKFDQLIDRLIRTNQAERARRELVGRNRSVRANVVPSPPPRNPEKP